MRSLGIQHDCKVCLLCELGPASKQPGPHRKPLRLNCRMETSLQSGERIPVADLRANFGVALLVKVVEGRCFDIGRCAERVLFSAGTKQVGPVAQALSALRLSAAPGVVVVGDERVVRNVFAMIVETCGGGALDPQALDGSALRWGENAAVEARGEQH
jgi:hypothetical protein